jgi:DNA-binding SARP family transcriptional activator
MLFRILGDVSVVRDDGAVQVAAPRQRALLVVLLLNANHVVSPPALVEAIWREDDRPQHPEAALHVAMSRLRSVLGPAAERIRSDSGGYRLDIAPDEFDLKRAEQLLREGRAALGLNDARRAGDFFTAALALWRGEAFEGLASFPLHAAAARRVRELHYTLYEARNDAFLIEGRHLEVLADIEAWVRAEPLREHLRGQQIAALYRSGRQADALHECGSLRAQLRDTLGVDPSAGIQELERRVLDQDPELLPTRAGLSVPLPAWTSETMSYVGRSAALDFARAALRRACVDGMRLVVVEGEAGVGKSRFLLEFAREVRDSAVILPVDIHESLRSSATALAATLKAAAQRMTSEDRLLTLGAVDDGMPAGEPSEAEVLSNGAQWVAALSAKAPVVLVIDDIDRAGPTLLHLIGHLSAIDRAKRVLVVASARSPIPATSPRLARLIGALERRDRVDVLPLQPLELDDVDELLARMRINPRAAIVAKLHDLTAGNPFLLAELLSTAQPERVVEEWTLPPRVRDVVLARVDDLGRAASEVLRAAAVFEIEFSVQLLSKIFGMRDSAMAAIVDRALDAHILQASGMHTYRFAHEIARRTLVEELTHGELGAAHRRIAIAIEDEGASAAGLAWHWSLADGGDAPSKTVEYARRAGDEARRVLEPDVAARWYSMALTHVAEDARGPLLVDLAEVQQQAGNPDYVETLRAAVQIAHDTRDDALLLRVVTSASPGWSTLPGFTMEETRALLAKTLLIPCDDATRSRVLARHATEQYLDNPVEGDRIAREAIALARRSNDRGSLLEALCRHSGMLITAAALGERQAELKEARPLAGDIGDVIAESQLTGSAVVAAIQAADLALAERDIAAADRILDRCDLAPLRWSAMTRRVWSAARAGNLEEAERLMHRTRAFGCTNGIGQAIPASLIQCSMLRWQQDCTATELRYDDADVAVVSVLPGNRHFLARALAAGASSQDAARTLMHELAQHDFDDVRTDLFWSSILVATAETAFLLGLPDAARAIRRLLEPYADQVAFCGLWIAAPIAHGVAVAAAACGDRDADSFFEHAVTVAERIEAPVLRGRALHFAALAAERRGDNVRHLFRNTA